MALVGGGYRHNLSGKLFGGTNLDGANPSFHVWTQHMTARSKNISASEAITDDKFSVPSGNRHPVAWIMPRKAGGLSSNFALTMSMTMTGSGVYGRNLSVNAPFSLDVSQANLALVVGGVASIPMSFTMTPNPNLVGVLLAASSFTGMEFTVNPTLGAKSGLGVTIPMTFSLNSTATAKGSLSANITGEGAAVTPTSVAAEVWNTVAAAFNTAGTMGNKLNAAGSGGVDYNALAAAVWQYVVESGITAEEAMRIYGAVLSGKVSGAGTGTEVFTGMDGTTVRVTSTVDAQGNRTSVVVDGT